MHRISAMVQSSRIEDVCKALSVLDVADLTVTEAHGFGRQRGHTTLYPSDGQSFDLLPKAKIEVVVARERLSEVVGFIAKAANTGKFGAGKIFVSEILKMVNII